MSAKLILNCPVAQGIDGNKLTMIDVIPAAVDVSGEAEGMVFVQGGPLVVDTTRTKSGEGNDFGWIYRTRDS